MLAAAAPEWYSLTWDQWVGVAGMPLTLIGLGLAWWQARKATDSAEAAKKAVELTQRQITAKQVQLLAPQLRWIANEIDLAIKDEERDLTRRGLDNWRWLAGQLHGMLRGTEDPPIELLQALMESVALAQTTGSKLLAESLGPLSKRSEKAQISIAKATDHLIMWAGENATKVISGENNHG